MENIELIKTGSDNVFFLIREGSKRLVTKNLASGVQVYGEKLITVGTEEYRLWNPYRSKLAAILLNGSSVSLKSGCTVLYLGAGNGTTVSHVSDIVAAGSVFAVELSSRAMHDLIRVSISRMNLMPILADANHPNLYKNIVPEVDIVYQDIAQREQAGIAMKNAELFLKKDGILILMIKSRSIDSAKKTSEVFSREIKKLEETFEVRELINLEPFHSDHKAVVAQKRRFFN